MKWGRSGADTHEDLDALRVIVRRGVAQYLALELVFELTESMTQ